MSMTDPIADMLTRIRNAGLAKLIDVSMQYSNVKSGILNVLCSEGFIESYTESEVDGKRYLKAKMKYSKDGEFAIKTIDRVSKPGRRMYSSISSLKPHMSGLGVSILSTPKGVMPSKQAKKLNVGGEIICKVF